MKHAFLENNLLFNSAMHSSLGASIAYSHSEKGVGKPHEFTSSQNAVCFPWSLGYALEGSMYVLTEQMSF